MTISYKFMDCNGKNPVITYETEKENEVFEKLASDLYNKKLCNCSYIKSIKRIQRYTHDELIVTYDNKCKGYYILPSSF